MVTMELGVWNEYQEAGLVTLMLDSGILMILETNTQEDAVKYSLVRVKIGIYATIHKGLFKTKSQWKMLY